MTILVNNGGRVIPFPERKEPHLSGKAHCILCRHAWVAVAPLGTLWMECPSCHAHKGTWTFEVGPDVGESRFVCGCGNELFYVLPTCLRCPNCGNVPELGA